MRPKELIEKRVDIFNEGDAAKIAELYHWDAINHQVANKAIEGRNAIKEMFSMEFSTADMTCIPENIFEDGE
ncbi:nuclear transport factor 2 family protein [Sediminitomix flava]|uniref:SnoaL-like protein n=1 Tax=Sediminitomix flava TaxID=379075 RepID=A0A315ZEG2_SEDFL|nr:nuclear transport factor 2 family protein [Sediminitomix flava]PWJ43208.1 SnoaL-like protein [Sediminitomix flava]